MSDQSKYWVCEKFVSINGEGMRSGELAVFIRFRKCNLSCSYCDTSWACTDTAEAVEMTAEDICQYIDETGVKNVTLTGGEPLLQESLENLILAISKLGAIRVEVETNGSQSIEYLSRMIFRPSFTMDYKLPSSNMEDAMCLDNLSVLTKQDTLKFVCGSVTDLDKASEIIQRYSLRANTNIYFSPVYGKLAPENIVEYMKENKLNGVRLQLQMHKFIWNPDERGV